MIIMIFKCPHCNEFIEADDRIDIDIDGDYVECKMIGHCPTCDRNYQWFDVYGHTRSYGFTLADFEEE